MLQLGILGLDWTGLFMTLILSKFSNPGHSCGSNFGQTWKFNLTLFQTIFCDCGTEYVGNTWQNV